MVKRRRRISHRAQPKTAWQALNTPIAYPSDEFARSIFLAATIIMLMVWLMPYWSQAPTDADLTRTHADRVAGEISVASALGGFSLPGSEWYDTARAIPTAVAEEFGQAAYEVLDISEPVGQAVEFYEPGVQAVWDAWLQLMADPYPTY